VSLEREVTDISLGSARPPSIESITRRPRARPSNQALPCVCQYSSMFVPQAGMRFPLNIGARGDGPLSTGLVAAACQSHDHEVSLL